MGCKTRGTGWDGRTETFLTLESNFSHGGMEGPAAGRASIADGQGFEQGARFSREAPAATPVETMASSNRCFSPDVMSHRPTAG